MMRIDDQYDIGKTAKKAAGGGIDGLIASIVAPLVGGPAIIAIRGILPWLPEGWEIGMGSAIGVGTAAAVVAAKRALLNFLKHGLRKRKAPTGEPAPK